MIHAEWSIQIPLIQRIMNATVHSAIGVAPASIITPGIDLNQGIIFPHAPNHNENETIISEYIQALQKKQAFIIRKVKNRLGALFAKNKANTTQLTK